MPIYMDRHDITESVTAEDVAHLHQEDLKVQDQFCCRALTYWFDSKRRTAFCLIEAPDEQTLRTMHQHAHGQVPNQVIEVDPSLVESFLGRMEDPAQAQEGGLNIIDEAATRTLLAIGIEPDLLPDNSSPINLSSIQELLNAIRKVMTSSGGRLVRQSGNKMLVSLASVTQAANAAIKIKGFNNEPGGGFFSKGWTISMGMATGDPVQEADSLFGKSSKLVERLGRISSGKILVSSAAHESGKLEIKAFQEDQPNLIFLSEKEEAFITLLMDYLDSRLEQPDLSVEDLTRPTRLSQSQLYRMLTHLTGRSPNQFIRDLRLRSALELMSRKQATIAEVAFQSGFTSPSYFTKCFQKKYGIIPSDYLAVR